MGGFRDGELCLLPLSALKPTCLSPGHAAVVSVNFSVSVQLCVEGTASLAFSMVTDSYIFLPPLS